MQLIRLAEKKIGYCKACDFCMKNHGICVQKDDMSQIYPVYKTADIIVLASPMYYWGITGQLKCAFDRLFAIAELNPNYENPQKEWHKQKASNISQNV